MKRPGLALLAAAALTANAGAQEWTRFRGPDGAGISDAKNVPVKWTEKDLLWRVETPGEGHSQPVIWGDRIFLTSARDEGRERLLICLAKKDGRQRWVKKVEMSTHRKHRFNSFASGSPVVDKDRVFAAFVTPEAYEVRAWDHSGKELWKRSLGAFRSHHGFGSSPVLFESSLIVSNDQDGESAIVALDVKTGKDVWTCPRRSGPTAFSTPFVLQREGERPQLLTTSTAHGISSIDPRTGRLNWEAKVFDKRAVSSPVVAGDLVFGTCGSGAGGIYLAAVRLGGKGDVTKTHLAYTLKDAAPYVPTPLVVGNRIYMISDNGIAGCADAATGRVLWTERLGGGFFSSPVFIDGRIYVNSKKGETIVLAAQDEFKLLARNPLGEGSYSTPCVDGDRLYLRTFTHLICVGPRE